MLTVNWVPLLFASAHCRESTRLGANISMMMQLMGLQSQGKIGVVMGLYAESENIGCMIANPTFGYVYTGFGSLSSLVLVSGVLLLAAGISLTRLRANPTSS